VVGKINRFIFKALEKMKVSLDTIWKLVTCCIKQRVQEMSAPLQEKVPITMRPLFSKSPLKSKAI
jgi:hypothetical protein